MSKGLDDADAHAKALGGTLGAVILDLNSGVMLDRNGDRSFPMGGVQKLIEAILAYAGIDQGALPIGTKDAVAAMLTANDDAPESRVVATLGGVGPINASLRGFGYSAIVENEGDNSSVATPDDLAHVLADLVGGHLLKPASRDALTALMAGNQTLPGGLRAGLGPKMQLMHQAGIIESDGMTTQANDIGVAVIGTRRVVIVAMLQNAKGTRAQIEAVLADVARAAGDAATLLGP